MSTSVKSHPSTQVTGETSWCARAMCSAMSRRTPRSGCRRPSCDSAPLPAARDVILGDPPAGAAAGDGGPGRPRAPVRLGERAVAPAPWPRARGGAATSFSRRLFRTGLLHVGRRGAFLADHDQHGPNRYELALAHEDARHLSRPRARESRPSSCRSAPRRAGRPRRFLAFGTSQRAISPWVRPSPRSGSLNSYAIS